MSHPKTMLAVRLWSASELNSSRPSGMPQDWPAQVYEIPDTITTPEERGLVKTADAVIDSETGEVSELAKYEEQVITPAQYAPVTELPTSHPASAGWQLMTREEYTAYRADATRKAAFDAWKSSQ